MIKPHVLVGSWVWRSCCTPNGLTSSQVAHKKEFCKKEIPTTEIVWKYQGCWKCVTDDTKIKKTQDQIRNFLIFFNWDRDWKSKKNAFIMKTLGLIPQFLRNSMAVFFISKLIVLCQCWGFRGAGNVLPIKEDMRSHWGKWVSRKCECNMTSRREYSTPNFHW